MMSRPKIYSDAYQLSLNVFERTGKFPKYARPTLGRRLEEASLNLTLSIYNALMTDAKNLRKRRDHLFAASECIDQIRIESQVARDLKFLAPSPYTDLCDLTAELGRQVGGLIKHNPQSKQEASQATQVESKDGTLGDNST